VYKDVLDQAEQWGIKTVYTLTDINSISPQWTGKKGRINPQMIMQEIPDYKERIFYISGPHAMVTAYQDVLKELGIKKENIKVDFFPGFV
jgi:NAD(P)H-flavin reductase